MNMASGSRNYLPRHRLHAGNGKPPPSGVANVGASGIGPAQTAGRPSMTDIKAKSVLKEAVDAVVNSFAKHTHGYGRGEF